MKRSSGSRRVTEIPDLQTQYEALLDTVWRSEERARQQERIDAQARFDAQQQQRRRGCCRK